MMHKLWNDEAGVVVSSEIVLVLTLLVLGVMVGLVELRAAVVDELNDVGEAIGSLNQSYEISGVQSIKRGTTIAIARLPGGRFVDRQDSADGNECAIVCTAPAVEEAKPATP